MNSSKCVAMILAGGSGERLGALTMFYSKPAVHFGSSHRIIDFTLNNCINSGIDTVGVLTQYSSSDLDVYINGVYKNHLEHNGIYMLPSEGDKEPYMGTADAVFKNIDFIDSFNPDYVLILGSDRVYNMDYRGLIAFHKKSNADITMASTSVQPYEALRYGIISADKHGKIYDFEDKPLHPKSYLASMGVYVFNWSILKRFLSISNEIGHTQLDFDKNILPLMLDIGVNMYTYIFNGYWHDIGTLYSLWEANMDLLYGNMRCHTSPIANIRQSIRQSILSPGCSILGSVNHSVLGDAVTVCKGAEVVDSVIMPGAYIGPNVKIRQAVIGPEAVIMDNTVIGGETGTDFFVDQSICSDRISLIAPWLHIREGMVFKSGSHIYMEQLLEYENNKTNVIKMPDLCQKQSEFTFGKIDIPFKRAREIV